MHCGQEFSLGAEEKKENFFRGRRISSILKESGIQGEEKARRRRGYRSAVLKSKWR